jgi:hypothetical protein
LIFIIVRLPDEFSPWLSDVIDHNEGMSKSEESKDNKNNNIGYRTSIDKQRSPSKNEGKWNIFNVVTNL